VFDFCITILLWCKTEDNYGKYFDSLFSMVFVLNLFKKNINLSIISPGNFTDFAVSDFFFLSSFIKN